LSPRRPRTRRERTPKQKRVPEPEVITFPAEQRREALLTRRLLAAQHDADGRPSKQHHESIERKLEAHRIALLEVTALLSAAAADVRDRGLQVRIAAALRGLADGEIR
jgi:hypothetical protein